MYLKWASHLWLSIQNFSFSLEEIFFGFGWVGALAWGGGSARSSPPPPWISPSLVRKEEEGRHRECECARRPFQEDRLRLRFLIYVCFGMQTTPQLFSVECGCVCADVASDCFLWRVRCGLRVGRYRGKVVLLGTLSQTGACHMQTTNHRKKVQKQTTQHENNQRVSCGILSARPKH